MSQRSWLSGVGAAAIWLPASGRQRRASARSPFPEIRGRLFAKYVALFVGVVCVALLANGAFQIWFFFQEHRASLIRIQHEQAEAAADKIGQFVSQIEAQLGWTVQLPWTAGTFAQRRTDAWRLFRQVPAITDLAQIDPFGHEQLRVSRLAPDVLESGIDFSNDPKFLQAVSGKGYYGDVYFRNNSEPYMTLALAGSRDAGVSAAEVNLKFIWDVVSQIKVGERGRVYVVDERGRLIAHPDISLVLSNTDLSHLAQVRAARASFPRGSADIVQVAKNTQGQRVLTASAPVPALSWLVFVELPTDEAYTPLYATIARTGWLPLLGALGLAFLAGTFLARKMVVPIQALRAGAARIGSGDLGQRISVKTGDELEELADQFNDMARKLQDSYANLEKKVESRTRELAQSVGELRALGEVSQAVNSTLDLESVLTTIVTNAVQLSGTDAGAIYVFDDVQEEFCLRTTYGMDQATIAALKELRIRVDNPVLASAIAKREPIQVPDLSDEAPAPVNQVILRAGYRSLLIAPLLRPDNIVGTLVVRRKEPGLFPKATVDLLKTFAAQSVLAIQNARLFSEIDQKSRQLELESKHKSQFLANMSHELRTPLNAILGYNQLLLNNIYGETTGRMRGVLTRVQSNGRDLLGLINDVLDLSKIEAGQLRLSLANYSIKQVVHSVSAAVEPLVMEKRLAFKLEVPPDLPPAYGDERRLTQVLLNLVSNAIKFTDLGEITIKISVANDAFTFSVRDTGPGIDPADQVRIFEEFQQADSSVTKKEGGTGLGLSIARHIIEMHGGRIWVDSSVGNGATFFFKIPVRAGQQVGRE
jgi:signal transduction histidine kinase